MRNVSLLGGVLHPPHTPYIICTLCPPRNLVRRKTFPSLGQYERMLCLGLAMITFIGCSSRPILSPFREIRFVLVTCCIVVTEGKRIKGTKSRRGTSDQGNGRQGGPKGGKARYSKECEASQGKASLGKATFGKA
jgi:hypothetical protein